MAIAQQGDSPAKLIELGRAGLRQRLREKKIAHRGPTLDKVLAWAAETTNNNIQDGPLHHANWTDLNDLYQHLHRQIVALERELAGYLVQTPYVRLMAIPGINMVSAPELAAETA